MADVPVLRTVAEAREWREACRGREERVALVPTMGALHEGHLGLIDAAGERAETVLVSIYVNPTQFGPDEDYDRYPRDLDRDVALAAERGATAVLAPPDQEIYPVEPTIWVEPGPLADRLCGASRPGHFRGVLTVVTKLFSIVEPEIAVFGRKDFQQSVLVRRMARELHQRVEVVVAPTVREPDGLALSSRNAYLDAAERQAALSLSRGLRAARRAFAADERDPAALESVARIALEESGAAVEYVELVEPTELRRPERAAGEHVLAVAARVGGTRLIDNAPLAGPSSLDSGFASGTAGGGSS